MTGNIGRARNGRQLDHRAVQRDGLAPVQQHHQPARRPRLRQRRAPRQGGRRARHRRGAHPARGGAGPTTRSWKGSWPARSAALWIVATNTAHSWINQADAHEVLGRLDLLVVQDMYATTETVAHAPHRAARGGLGRKGGHVHQLRAPHRAAQEGGARARRGAGRLLHLPADRGGVGLRRHVRALEDARGGVRDPEGAVARAAVRHHRHRRLRHDRGPARHPVAAARGRRRRARQRAAPVRGRPLLPRRRPRALHLRGAARRARADRRALSVRAADRARQLQPVAHADAHGEVGDAAQALPVTAVRRDQPEPTRAPSA